MEKGLLFKVIETVEQHYTERQASAPAQGAPSQPSRLRHIVRWFLPNGSTLLLVAALVLTANAWARPLLSPASAPGPSATTVNYQGRLADHSGNPLNGTYGMAFSLWDAATGDNLVWGLESHAAVPVSQGLFSVGLGSQTSGGIPTSVWNGDRYLEIAVGGETLVPRELIRSVPVAGMALTVPDGVITSRQVHLTNGQVVPTDDLNLTTSPKTVPGMRATLSPITHQTYIFYLVVEFVGSGSIPGFGWAQLYVDGLPVPGGQHAVMDWSAEVCTAAQVYRVDLTAGTHAIEVRAGSWDGGGQVQKWQTSLTWFAVSQ
jgi:hypothetical protein